MIKYECDRCHKQYAKRNELHLVEIRLHDWHKKDSYWADAGGGDAEICLQCVNEITTLFNDFMRGVIAHGTNESDTGNGD